MSVHVSHITSCAGNAMYQKSPNHSTLTYPNYLPVRFKTRKCPHHTPTGPAASSSSQNSPRGSQPLTAQLTLPSLWTLWGGAHSGFQNHPKNVPLPQMVPLSYTAPVPTQTLNAQERSRGRTTGSLRTQKSQARRAAGCAVAKVVKFTYLILSRNIHSSDLCP